ncbi:MAG: hypothetical protein LBQ33_07475 [Oscillospiraceae bacterium]|jgi:hypothetical protein|nr:hypothetical protein [Oscillospiraceae bacterium]
MSKCKKVLAVLLCAMTIFSVTATMAYAAESAAQTPQAVVLVAAQDAETPEPEPPVIEIPTDPEGTPEPSDDDDFIARLALFWEWFYPLFDQAYKQGFVVISMFLAQAVQVLFNVIFY